MIAIWGQSQVADIDATNTLATALTALCGIELLVVRPARTLAWIIAATVAMSAMLMTKAHAGLPIVLGVWIWAAIVRIRESRAGGAVSLGRSRTPIAFLAPFIVAIGVIGAWWLAANHSLGQHGFTVDARGAKEATERLHPNSPAAFFKSLFVILPQLVAFGLPAVLALPMFFNIEVRRAMSDSRRRIARALAAATLISWGIFVLAAVPNPRYGYPDLMLLCPLAGATAVAAVATRRAADWLRGIAMGTAVAFFATAAALSILAYKAPHFLPLLILSTLLAAIAAVWTIRQLSRSWNGAWGLVALILLTSVPFGAQRHWARTTKDSAINIAPELRRIIGENNVVAVCGAATSKPEAFYYARVRPDFIPLYDFNPRHVQGGTWIMLDQAEHKLWLKQPNSQLEHDRKICRWGETDYYLAWYPKPILTSPPTRN